MSKTNLHLFFILLLCLWLVDASSCDSSDYSNGISDRLHLSGEAGADFFDTEADGEFPNDEFRVDEAKLFLEAAIVNDIYVFLEVDVFLREEPEEKLALGELYLEFEDVSKLWNQERVLNLRIGRFDIPFGEEYLTRDLIDNPLITHSLIDNWGVDEGIEAYGSIKQFEYVFAIQNGSEPILNDFNADKAIAGRLLFRPRSRLHFSFSAMRTGDLDVEQDKFSEVWFGNGFVRVLGSPLSTTTFAADLFQADGHMEWQSGHVHLSGGKLHYDDDDTVDDNHRNVHYFQVEALQNLNRNKDTPWYSVARFSRLTSDRGFPMVGNGEVGRFLFDDNLLTEELWRLSLGVGYRIKRNLLVKMEYCFENGTQVNGQKRDAENLFGVAAAVRF